MCSSQSANSVASGAHASISRSKPFSSTSRPALIATLRLSGARWARPNGEAFGIRVTFASGYRRR
jgi:hypothetical protein